MRNLIRVFLVLILSTLVVNASQDARIADEKASKKILIPLKEAIGAEAYEKAIGTGNYRYVGSSKCRLCHRKFFLGRKKDPHDSSMDSLIKSGYENDSKCLNCHSTGHGVPTGFVSIEKTPRLSNVQCEGCHGPGNMHIKQIKSKSTGGFLAGADNPVLLKKMCTECHTERWNKAYHDLDPAYDKYKAADPNAKAR